MSALNDEAAPGWNPDTACFDTTLHTNLNPNSTGKTAAACAEREVRA